MASESSDTGDLLQRIRSEFAEMPGLRLTEPQARRLWGLDRAACEQILTSLLEARYLFRTRDGAYMRIDGGVPVRAELRTRTIAAA
jgi:hypothetical protein